MDAYLSPNLRRLQDCHRLHNKWIAYAKILADFPSARRISDVLEDPVVLVQRVPDFVDGLPRRGHQFAVLESFGLEEEADFVRGLEEVLAEPVL